MIIVDFIILLIGFVALIKGADLFVDGSASLARRVHVSSVVIGLTIVAFGTSAPELAVSTSAALRQSNELAVSNVVGSNLFNLLVVLGLCAIVAPIPVSSDIIKRDLPFSILATVAVWIMGGGFASLIASNSDKTGMINRYEGLALIVVFLLYMFYLIREAGKNPEPETEDYEELSFKKCMLYMISGIILIVAGGQAVVEAAKSIAYSFGMSETLVGLTIVAVGTSLPELVTSVVASRKHENGLAVGNVVGSNLFNIMFILGTTAFINPVDVNASINANILFLLFISVLTLLFVFRKKELNRTAGIIMVVLYVAQVVYAANM